MTGERIRVAIIAGSRRPNRRSRAVAEWVCQASTLADLQCELVDLKEVGLPPLAEPAPAAFGDYTLPHTREWSELVSRFDAYVLVTPEYNHSTTAALKDALDHLYREWHDKPVAFVGYGVDGGIRAVEHLRQITAELGLAGVGPSVSLSLFEDFDSAGVPNVRDRQQQQLHRMLDTLHRWARALQVVRSVADAASEAEDPSDDRLATRHERPTLERGSRASVAEQVATDFVRSIQDGLDRGDADGYDSAFASDVFWGAPYGDVLTGFAPVNAAHRSMMTRPRPGHSRYEIVQTAMPVEGVVVAHVRRNALQPEAIGSAAFSEVALYVLVERDGRWWLAAGQNTPITEKP